MSVPLPITITRSAATGMPQTLKLKIVISYILGETMSRQHHHAHKHEHEHGVQHSDGLIQPIAIFTAILATIAAVVSFLGAHTQNEALYHQNDAVLKKAEASNQWNFYQSKSQKENLAKFAGSLITDPEKLAFYKKEAERYAKEKDEIKAKAEAFDKESKEANIRSEEALHPYEKLEISMTFLEIAIALASVTALTNKRWLLYVAGGAALVGCASGVLAYFV